MKEFITKHRSLMEETEQLLNKQIKLEAVSSALYLSMASWAEIKGYQNSAAFLYKHAGEEHMHMMKIFRYVNQAGGHALQPEISGVPHDFKSLRAIFENILEHEIVVTKSIHSLVDHCFNNKDFTTFSFLQWYVTEQREEETLARRVLELFNIIGEEGLGLWTIDQEIGKLGVAAAASDAAGESAT
jgi:ferritin